jgi:hypothetical protein
MRLHQRSSFGSIGRLLRLQYGDIANERLPERWIDLINYLNERDRAEAERGVQKTAPGANPASRSN